MAVIEPDARVVPNPRAVFRKLAEGSGGVVLHLDTAAYHGVNEVGAHIWNLLGSGMRFGDLVAKVKEDVDGAPPTLEDEVAEFVEALHARELVSVTVPGGDG